MAGSPLLSVVLVTPTGLAPLRRTLTSLAAQTIAGSIEIVIVAPAENLADGAERLLAPFCAAHILAVGPIPNVDHAAARGLLAASAPLVASIEDHAFPEPEWAERLLEVWDADCVAVGSAMLNANPRGTWSWSNHLVAYGQWSESVVEGDTDWVALHNGCYRRSAIEPFGSDLPRLFNRESEVLVRLRDAGGRFRFAPKARIRHLNPSSPGPTARLRMDAGRLYAAKRAADGRWGKGKRVAYALLGPLIPIVRYVKMRKDLFAPGRTLREFEQGPNLMVGLIFDAIGQMAGYVAGPGGARDRLATFEMDRMQHLSSADKATFEPSGRIGSDSTI